MTGSAAIIRCLGLVSVISGVLIVGTSVITQERIRINQETITRESVAQLLPGAEKQVTYGVEPSGDLKILGGADASGPKMFAGYSKEGKLLGVVLETSDRGYADVITALYAYDPVAKAIIGFRVVEMRETPGLGDKIGKDIEFVKNFLKLDATHPIVTVKHGTKKNPWEIDAISGATISSRAVGRMLQKGVQEMTPIVARNLERIQRGN